LLHAAKVVHRARVSQKTCVAL